ncbi:unnamed protein product, partial [Vitis vinifera]
MLTTVEKVSLTSLRESFFLHEDKGYDDCVSSVIRIPSRNDSSPELGTPFTVTEIGTSSISRSKLGSPPAANSWLGSLFAIIIGILKISISNVHIKYEDSIINPGHPFSSGVISGKLVAATMDEQGMKTSTPMMITIIKGMMKLGEANACLKQMKVSLDVAEHAKRNAKTEAALAKESSKISKLEVKRIELMLSLVIEERDQLRNVVNKLKKQKNVEVGDETENGILLQESITNMIPAVARICNALAYATHTFFQNHGFLHAHTPIITTSDCEGAGEMFQIDYSQDFFARQAFFTVSGQLQVETYACAIGSVYTFGPTFRAEHSHTSRHLAEFWMVEPEIAFADLKDDMNCAEAYVKFLCQWLPDNCIDDMEFMAKIFDKGSIDHLRMVASMPFERISYAEAIKLLEEAVKKDKKFENKVEWGIDLASEHDQILASRQGHIIAPNPVL